VAADTWFPLAWYEDRPFPPPRIVATDPILVAAQERFRV
jgi:hypothetical protein